MTKLTHKYRPKADRQLLRDLVYAAWEKYSAEQFPKDEEATIAEKVAVLLEQRFPPADMEVLMRYGAAREVTEVSINIYDPDHRRWDCHAGVKLQRPVSCPQGRAWFFVGGTMTADRDDRLPAEFEPFFNKVLAARKAYNAESRFTPERNGDGYPTWEQIAEQLPVAGAHIRSELREAD